MPRLPLLPLLLTLIPALLAWPAKAVQARDALVLSAAPAEPVIEGMAVLREAYARLGIQVIFRDYPARRGLAEADAGGADGEAARMGGLGSELPNLIQVRPSIVSVQGVAVTCDPDLTIRDRRDLVPLRIGVHTGLRLSDKLVQGLDRVTQGHWDQLFHLLYLGRLDVIIGYDGIERTQAGHPGAERLRVIRPVRWRVPLYHYLNRRHADLVPRLEAVLERMRINGEMARLRAGAGAAHQRPAE
ncbi:substrate-binding periplasmic protein [Pseudodesulfovibrio mercurii]|nr:ABC transporter substrate-binding protein [Pseudodesulfovibrio mercurii]